MAGSIVSSNDAGQAGWWGINNDGLNNNGNSQNIVSNLAIQFGPPSSYYGTSQDITTVANFNAARDAVDISVSAFSNLLENGFYSGNAGVPSDVAVATPTATTAFFTQAVFSSPAVPGYDVVYNNPAPTSHFNVLVLTGVYTNAAAVAETLGSPTGSKEITFDNGLALNQLPGPQALDYAGHLIIAYQNQGGSTGSRRPGHFRQPANRLRYFLRGWRRREWVD